MLNIFDKSDSCRRHLKKNCLWLLRSVLVNAPRTSPHWVYRTTIFLSIHVTFALLQIGLAQLRRTGYSVFVFNVFTEYYNYFFFLQPFHQSPQKKPRTFSHILVRVFGNMICRESSPLDRSTSVFFSVILSAITEWQSASRLYIGSLEPEDSPVLLLMSTCL